MMLQSTLWGSGLVHGYPIQAIIWCYSSFPLQFSKDTTLAQPQLLTDSSYINLNGFPRHQTK